MADAIDAIPDETRWEIATKGLTGAYIAISSAFQQAMGSANSRSSTGRCG